MTFCAELPLAHQGGEITRFVCKAGLSLYFYSHSQGKTIPLEYRVDADGMPPVSGVIQLREASEEKDLTPLHYP